MTVLDDDQIPFDPYEEPPDDEPVDEPPAPDERIAAGAEALGITYQEAAELDAAARTAEAESDQEHELAELAHFGLATEPDLPHSEQLRRIVGRERARRGAEAGHLDLDAFLSEPDPEYDWLIPGLLEHGDRVILTGQEGKGKSTLLRQICVQTSSGIHPFTLEEIAPKRSLLIDVENPRRLIRRQLRPLRLSAGKRLVPGFMIPVTWGEGIDLTHTEDVERLAHLLDILGTDILVIGPSYKLASGDPNTEETAKTVTSVLDELRIRYGFALILEAHQPYAATAGAKRAERPYGASLWSRWPEFGLHLADGGELRHWRGDRDQRDWPKALKRGGTWPWTAITDTRSVTFAKILDATRDAGHSLSTRELAGLVGGDHTTIGRAIKNNQADYNALLIELGEEPQ